MDEVNIPTVKLTLKDDLYFKIWEADQKHMVGVTELEKGGC